MSDTVFVGFQFTSTHYRSESLTSILLEALTSRDLVPFFPGDHYEPVHITCEICHALQESLVCIFEVSDGNPNVMLEVGLAFMLGKPTMLLAKKGSQGTSIADIAGIHRIQYDDLVECRDLLCRFIDSSHEIQSVIAARGRDVTADAKPNP